MKSILIGHLNHSNRIRNEQLIVFSGQLVGLPILPGKKFAILYSQCLVSIFETGSLGSFKAKVIRDLFQLESPNSKHRNSSYVQNNSDYSMIKTEIRIWLTHGPTLSEFLSHFGWSSLKYILIYHLNHSNRIRNEQVMAFAFQLVGLPMLPRNSLQY